MSTIVVFVTSGDDAPVGLRIATDAYVFELIDAVIKKLIIDAAPGKVHLRPATDGAGKSAAVKSLNPCVRLPTAGVHDECHLVVEVLASPSRTCQSTPFPIPVWRTQF
jgi:hypothetical protein